MPKKTKPAPAPEMVSVPLAALHGIMWDALYFIDQINAVPNYYKLRDYHGAFIGDESINSNISAVHRAMVAHERAKKGKK
jgi:hypothetical protein